MRWLPDRRDSVFNRWLIGGGLAGWAIAGFLFWAWLGAREDLASAVERCNVRVAHTAALAEKTAREATEKAYQARLAKEREMHGRTRKALKTALVEAEQALSRPPRVREVIKREVDLDACLAAPIPDNVVRVLRD